MQTFGWFMGCQNSAYHVKRFLLKLEMERVILGL
jgi:hypothetical protein